MMSDDEKLAIALRARYKINKEIMQVAFNNPEKFKQARLENKLIIEMVENYFGDSKGILE